MRKFRDLRKIKVGVLRTLLIQLNVSPICSREDSGHRNKIIFFVLCTSSKD
jgi:hypothetical protein